MTEPAARAPFWKALLDGPLCVLGRVNEQAPSGATRTLKAGEKLQLFQVDHDGQPACIAFTSVELLQRSIDHEEPYIALPGRSLFETTAGTKFLLNPCGPFGKVLLPDEIRLALAGTIYTDENRIEVLRETQVFTGRLAECPTDLLDAIARTCKGTPGIRAAYHGGVSIPGSGSERPHPLIGIDAVDYSAALAVLHPIVRDWCSRTGLLVDIVSMHEQNALASYLRADGERFFPRGLLARLFG